MQVNAYGQEALAPESLLERALLPLIAGHAICQLKMEIAWIMRYARAHDPAKLDPPRHQGL